MVQLMPLPLTVSCYSKIQIGFTTLVPAYLGSPGQRAIKRVCVYLIMYFKYLYFSYLITLQTNTQNNLGFLVLYEWLMHFS